jgi:hypothetical protein
MRLRRMHCQTFVSKTHKRWHLRKAVQAACESGTRFEALYSVILDAAISPRSDCGVHIKPRFPGVAG